MKLAIARDVTHAEIIVIYFSGNHIYLLDSNPGTRSCNLKLQFLLMVKSGKFINIEWSFLFLIKFLQNVLYGLATF